MRTDVARKAEKAEAVVTATGGARIVAGVAGGETNAASAATLRTGSRAGRRRTVTRARVRKVRRDRKDETSAVADSSRSLAANGLRTSAIAAAGSPSANRANVATVVAIAAGANPPEVRFQRREPCLLRPPAIR